MWLTTASACVLAVVAALEAKDPAGDRTLGGTAAALAVAAFVLAAWLGFRVRAQALADRAQREHGMALVMLAAQLK